MHITFPKTVLITGAINRLEIMATTQYPVWLAIERDAS